ncbi:MAG: exodeoxyribonuclease VII large subunit [Bacillota bacterium]|nr:exodeoxyribonuclease VII large subunit [Bacillota bacterium]
MTRELIPELRGVAGRRVLTVSELTQHIKRLLEVDPLLSSVLVQGEISNLRQPGSGHIYFTLKDESAALRCVMFRSARARLKFEPHDGLAVDVQGYISLYPRDGQYQLYAEVMRPAGLGDLYLAFEQLKARLSEEGLFRAEDKRRPPMLPRRVAVVTSPTGAAVRDVLKVAARRCPGLQVVVVPAQVQGEGAAAQIVRGLIVGSGLPGVDVVILTRGGGSLEELWAFNEEPVARAIRACPVPVVVGVGHEVDVTIADLAADVRAPTPSAAAEMVFPDCAALNGHLSGLVFRLAMGLRGRARALRQRLVRVEARPPLSKPETLIGQRAQRLDSLTHGLAGGFRRQVERGRARLGRLSGQLDALSPLNVLARGYALCTVAGTGRLVRSAAAVPLGEMVSVRLATGRLGCRVEETWPEGEHGQKSVKEEHA